MIPRKLKPCRRCGDPCYLFSGGMCRNCWGMTKIKEQQEQVKKGINPAKPFKVIKKVSDKQAKLNRIYEVAAMQFKKDKPLCMARLPGCTGATTDVHHKKGRGEYLLEIATWLPVCRFCHDWIENNPVKAKELGLSESRLSK